MSLTAEPARQETRAQEPARSAPPRHASEPQFALIERVVARATLVVVGGAAVGGAAFMLSLALLLEAARLLGFLLGFVGDDVLKHEVPYVCGAAAVASAALCAVWVGVQQAPERRWWRALGADAWIARLSRGISAYVVMAVALVGYAGYARLVFLYSRIHGGTDEGMYLVGARSAMSGGISYHDFPTIQGPLYPYILGLFMAPAHFEENAARIFALVTTAACLVLVAITAGALAGRLAAALALLFLVTNLDFIADVTSGVHPSGAPGSLLLVLSALLFARRRPLWAIVPLAVATGSRVLFAPLAVMGVLAAAVMLREAKRPLVVGGALAVAAFAPFLLADPRAAWFDIIGHQSQRVSLLYRLQEPGSHDTLRTHLQAMQEGAVQALGAYWPFLLLSLLVAALLSQPDVRARLGGHRVIVLAFLTLASAVMFLVDLLPYPFMARYPVPQLPLLAIAGAVALSFALRDTASPLVRQVAAATTLGILIANPFQATREAPGQINFVEQYRTKPPVAALNRVSDYVRSVTPPDGVLITLETPVATQSGRKLWPGLEVTAWGILKAPDSTARAVKMMTPNMLAEAIESGKADAVVVSDRYTWTLPNLPNKDRLQRALAERYQEPRSFDDVSDWGTVRVYLPKKP